MGKRLGYCLKKQAGHRAGDRTRKRIATAPLEPTGKRRARIRRAAEPPTAATSQ
nr:MAG TPA: hypothetical protein [Bacteriophage sp.]